MKVDPKVGFEKKKAKTTENFMLQSDGGRGDSDRYKILASRLNSLSREYKYEVRRARKEGWKDLLQKAGTKSA